MTEATHTTGILFAAPGTTCPEGLEAYRRIGRAAAARFAGVEQRWAYTSAGVRRQLAAQGAPVNDPDRALAAMQTEGFTRIVVLSLHLTDGMEFGELADTVDTFRRRPGNGVQVALSGALLPCPTDCQRALRALLAALPGTLGEHERLILVLHGSRDPRAKKTLQAAAQLGRGVDRRLILGMMLGAPGLDDVVRECRLAGVTKAWLLPGMVAAGYSAREDITGAGEGSWATTLQRAGIEPVLLLRGLGEVDGVVNIWMDRMERLLAEGTEANGSEG